MKGKHVLCIALALVLIYVGLFICWEREYFPADTGGAYFGSPSNTGMILGPMRMPAMKTPEWLSGGIGYLIEFLFGCGIDGCVVTNQPINGGGGGGWPPCNTCNMSGPPGTTPGGGGGWARKANPWNWFNVLAEQK